MLSALLLTCVLGLLNVRRWLFLVALAVALFVSPVLALSLLLVAGGVGAFNKLIKKRK